MSDDDHLARAIEEEIEGPYKLITEAYEKAPEKRIKAARLVVYRCEQRGCKLLDIWQVPGFGPCFYIPPYQLSQERNARQTSSGARQESTIDGERSWQARGGPLEDFRHSGGGFMLHCDHVQRHMRCEEIIADVDAATPGRPTTRRLAKAPSFACWCGSLRH
jgi:hypothetical protein